MDLKSPARWSRRRLFISIFAVLLIILAVVIPLAVILPRRGGHVAPSVLLSLYIYPSTNTSWLPLYDALEAHPTLNFVVIVNPNSGPGDSQSPDSNYDPAVRKLNSYPNAKTVGYVRTGYATRNISTVISEVNTYAGWASISPDLAMHGIFFDEAPHEYNAEAVPYMQTVNQAVKNNTGGLMGDKTVIHNPGVIPDPRYDDPSTDITVIFEESYPVFQSRLSSIQAQPKTPSHYAFFINSVPTQSIDSLRNFVNQLSQLAEFLFITEESVDFYQSFGAMWQNFTTVVSN